MNLQSMRKALYCVLLVMVTTTADAADYSKAREQMVEEVYSFAELVREDSDDALSRNVMRALGTVKRH